VQLDTTGREVRTLLDEDLPAGPHSITWDGTNNRGKSGTTGLYFYALDTGSFHSTKKMVLLR